MAHSSLRERYYDSREFKTSDKIKRLMLSKKYWQYFFPSLITAIALSLSEFVDSMVVANLLDSDALGIVNLGTPLMTVMSTIYMLFGAGGAIGYSESLGQQDEKTAGEFFTCSTVATLSISTVMLLLGIVFLIPFANLLSPGLVFGEEFLSYLRVLLYSMPFLTVVSMVFIFLPAAGSPNLSMALNIFANVLNLILDVVYIRVFHLGVNGAAYATLTSFILAGLILAFVFRKTNLRFGRLNLKHLVPSVKKGMAMGLTQIGYTLKFGYCNRMASVLGGADALIALTLCFQTISIISIVLSGTNDTVRPLVAFMRSQEDFKGVRFVIFRTLQVSMSVSIAFMILLLVFPQSITGMFNANEPEVLSIAFPALRIFSLTYLLRSVVVLYTAYTSIIGLTGYSMFLSLFDGFVGIIAICTVMIRFFGMYGIFITYPVDCFILVIIMIIVNNHLAKKYPERFEDAWLIDKMRPDVHLMDIALPYLDKDISKLSEKAQDYCLNWGMSRFRAHQVGLCAEEMAVYTRQHARKEDWLNLLLKVDDHKAVLDFRSLGSPFDLNVITEKDIEENFQMLRAIAPAYSYTYSLGMNNTRFIFPLH